MARLLLYTDLSPSRLWLSATVHANRALLAEHGIDLGPVPPRACTPLSSHPRFWTIVPEGGAIPPALDADLHHVAAQLDAGRDVLLMGAALNLLAHRSLSRLLRQRLDLTRHEARALFLVGRPACVLEQRCRGAGKAISPAVGETLLSRCNRVSLLLKDARRDWGECNVTLLADTSDSPVAAPRDAVARDLFAALSELPGRGTRWSPLS